jgi:hyaluronan synthase
VTAPLAVAARTRPRVILTGGLILTALAVWAAHHTVETLAIANGAPSGRLTLVYAATFVFLAFQAVLYHCERPKRCTPRQGRQLDAMRAEVLVPVYQEDVGYLRATLASLLAQTRLPDAVHVVDDGSTIDYAEVRAWFEQAAAAAGVEVTWQRQANAGKRHAQGAGVRVSPNARVYITVDSDADLDPRAIEELLIPLVDPRVQSVAGIVLAANNRGPARPDFVRPEGSPTRKARREAKWAHRRRLADWRGSQLLCRITDLYYVTGQLTDRSALSAAGSVLVNSGVLAAYRAEIIRDNLDGYLSETIAGRPVTFSDDSMLTLYALLRGKTVQQPSAVVYTAMPERVDHAVRQYLRWMRGSTIRSLWRLRYLEPARVAYWLHLMRWMQMAVATVVFAYLFIAQPAVGHAPPWTVALAPILIGYAQGLRYLTVRRPDETLRSQLATWALAPLAVLWAWTVLRSVRWYAMATCLKTGWGTRQNGAEVSLAPAIPIPRPDAVTAPLKLLDPLTDTTLEMRLDGRGAA